MTNDESTLAQKLTRVQNRSLALRHIFGDLNGDQQIFKDELHHNQLGATYLGVSKTRVVDKDFFDLFVLPAPQAILTLRQKPTDPQTVHREENHSKDPFGWMVYLLNNLNLAQEAGLEINHDEISHVLTREAFEKLMQAALARRIEALEKVGDSQTSSAVINKLGASINQLTEAYAEGVDAKEYVDIMATTLTKVEQLPDSQQKTLGFAIIGVLEEVSQHLGAPSALQEPTLHRHS